MKQVLANQTKSVLYVIISAGLLLLTSVSLAQAPPVISASQYSIKVTGNLVYNYAYPIGNSQSFTFNSSSGSVTNSVNYSGSGIFSQEFFASEVIKPVTFSALQQHGYYTLQCDNPSLPICGGGGIGVSLRGADSGQSSLRSPSQGGNGPVSGYVQPPNPGECTTCWNVSNISTCLSFTNIPLRYPVFDTTLVSNGNSVNVNVKAAGDNDFNLPSADKISIVASNYQSGYTWKYAILDPTNIGNLVWVNVPSTLVSTSGAEILVCGEDLWPNNDWMNKLFKTILFKLERNVNGVLTSSNALVYTHRLSSPKIVSVTPFQNKCYAQDSAYVKIKMSRALIANEKLNIFLKDKVFALDFSALNLVNTNFDGTNTYTWPQELVDGNYDISLIGKYNEFATYTGSSGHFSTVTLTDPPLLQFYLSQDPAPCYGGFNGDFNMDAKGGTGNYKYQWTPDTTNAAWPVNWTDFSNPTVVMPGFLRNTVTGLNAQNYRIRLRDANNCQVKDSLGREICKIVKVAQPQTPLGISMLSISPITNYYATDGAITVRIAGGTPALPTTEFPNTLPYTYEWRDSATGTLYTNSTLNTTGGIFETTLSNLGPGTVFLMVKDANYSISGGLPKNRAGCVISMYIPMNRPALLAVNITTDKPVTCAGFATGNLKANASGGIPISDTIKYNFNWYKKISNVFVMQSVHDSILRNVSAGIYRVDMLDKYNNLKQSNEYTLAEPPVLDAMMSSTSPTCYFSPNGSMTAFPYGGTAPYTYEWSNGAHTQVVPNVPGGNYVVVVKDANLCLATKQVTVTLPNKIENRVQLTPVACANNSNGSIALTTAGGSGGYTYLWSNGATQSSISNLPAGTYWYRVTDTQGCYDTDTLTLSDPDSYTVSAGADRKVCTGQTIKLTAVITGAATGLTTTWQTPQGSNSNNPISITAPGTYIVTVANAFGCAKKDTVVVTTENNTVNTNFTVSTQIFANENTSLVNISPQLQDSVQWILPVTNSITLLNSSKTYCELKFADTGKYTIGIRAFYSSGCIDEKFKDIQVLSKVNLVNPQGNESFLKVFGLYPNPTSGQTTLSLEFSSSTVARVRIYNILTNQLVTERNLQGAALYTELFNLTNNVAGTYVVVIETPKGNFVHKLNKL